MKTASLLIPFIKDRRANGSKEESSKKHSYICLLQIILGINRLHLFHFHKVIIYSSYLYTFILFVFTSYCLWSSQLSHISKTYTVHAATTIIEYAFTIWNALLQRKPLLTLFDVLKRKDTTFSGTNHQAIVFNWSFYVLAVMSVHELFEVIIGIKTEVPMLWFISYIPIFAQDSEILFYCFLLNQLYTRVESIKVHVEYVVADYKSTKVQKLNAKSVSISSLHEAYDLLRTCSRSINTAFNCTLSSILFICGTTTIFGVQNLFKLISKGIIHKEITASYFYTILFITSRCIKCAFLVTVPCYCCSLVKNQVKTIRSLLHSGINSKEHKYQRDELKAFFQLTKDNDFSQKLFNVINLTMDFPLKYLHTCLTYIIILIQFSKFID